MDTMDWRNASCFGGDVCYLVNQRKGKHIEMIPGDWKGCNESEINNCPETLSLIERCQTDFSAPSLESHRQINTMFCKVLIQLFISVLTIDTMDWRTISLVSVVIYVFNQSKKGEEYRDESRILERLQSIRAAPLSLDSVLDRKMPAWFPAPSLESLMVSFQRQTYHRPHTLVMYLYY